MKIEVDCFVTTYSGSVYGAYLYYNLKTNKDDSTPIFLWKQDREKHASVHFADRHTYIQDKNICYVDEVEVARETYSAWSIDISLYLFGRHNWDGQFVNGSSSRIYSCKIWDDNVLMRDFVPCYNQSLQEFGMYDLANGNYYGNLGENKFYSSYNDPSDGNMFFDQEQYYVDHNLANNFAATTITGTGAEDDPYVLNSTEDFWWARKYLTWSYKYVELTCDVVLNEEKFDKNGNVIEGTSVDGKVYSWDNGISGTLISFNGKGNTVFGLYYNNPEKRGGALFSGQMRRLQNLSMSRVFIHTKNESAAFANSGTLNADYENCHLLSGNVIGTTCTSGLFFYATSVISCSNYATVDGTAAVSGIAYYVSKEIYDTKNYGSVNSSGYYAAGISANYDRSMKVSFCENYGEITANAYAGGICAACYGQTPVKEIFHCKNYGKIQIIPNDYVGGIIAYSCGQVIINGCENYGEVVANDNRKMGAIIARIYTMSGTTTKTNAIITNCYAKVKGNIPFAGQIVYESASVFENNVYENDSSEGFTALFCRSMSSLRFVKIKNLKIKVNATANMSNLLFLNHYMTKISMENVLIEANKQVISLWPSSTKFEKLDGIMVNTPNQNLYYGSNFSGFNISWKTGEISLNSISSVGSFAPRLTEENLLGMGYQKRT